MSKLLNHECSKKNYNKKIKAFLLQKKKKIVDNSIIFKLTDRIKTQFFNLLKPLLHFFFLLPLVLAAK